MLYVDVCVLVRMRVCMLEGVCASEYRCPGKPEEDIWFLGVGVLWICDLFDMGVRNQI